MKYDISKKLALVKFYYDTLAKYDEYDINDNFSYEIAILTPTGIISGKPTFHVYTKNTQDFRLIDFICDHNLILNDYNYSIEENYEKHIEKLKRRLVDEDAFLHCEPLEIGDTLVLRNATIHCGNKPIKVESITIFTENILGISFFKKT